MGRYEQNPNGKGSLRRIQEMVNKHPGILNKAIINKIKPLIETEITWVSPVQDDKYAEYRDNDFLIRLSLNSLEVPLNKFWPQKGPQWDGLGETSAGKVFLVEAKANIPELVSPPTGAKYKNSLIKIQKSLAETKEFVKSHSVADWSSYFYQYTNRLAHLYFLRIRNRIDAYLVFVYFINDESVKGPKTKEEWEGAIKVMEEYLGINKEHKLSKYIIDVFIDINEMFQ